MNLAGRMSGLIEDGFLPIDSVIISDHNNLVVASENEKSVTRIGMTAATILKENPNDVEYSHNLAYKLGSQASVLSPFNEKPVLVDDLVLSAFPMLKPVDWKNISGESLFDVIDSFQNSYFRVSDATDLSSLDVYDYASKRMKKIETSGSYDKQAFDITAVALSALEISFPFSELCADDTSLVHGDLHAGNILENDAGILSIIDLDSIAHGPRLYDLASWNVRFIRGDSAPIDKAIAVARGRYDWNEEAYQALMGWKIISSMTHALRHENAKSASSTVETLAKIGKYVTQLPAVFRVVNE